MVAAYALKFILTLCYTERYSSRICLLTVDRHKNCTCSSLNIAHVIHVKFQMNVLKTVKC